MNIKDLLGDVDRVMTMDEVVKNISPPVSRYTVRQGDTLWDIAEKYGVPVREIVRLNPNIKNPNLIKEGEDIDVPGSSIGTSDSSDRDYIGNKLDLISSPSAEEDAIEGSYPETMLPGLGQLGKLAASGAANGVAGLARAAPAALPRAGMAGNNMVKGAVNWPGAKPSMSNVAPTGNPGMVKAMLAKMQGRRPLGQGGQMPPGADVGRFMNRGSMPPGPNQALGQGARMPTLGQGTGMPPQNTSLLDALRQGSQKMNAGGNEAIIQRLIQKTGGQPTLAGLQSAGLGQLQGAGGNQSFQELLRRVGYGR